MSDGQAGGTPDQGFYLYSLGCNSHISLVWLSDLRVIRVHASGAIT